MTTASEGDNGTRRMRRYEQPKVQLDMPDVWHGLCLGACAVTYRLLGFAPDSDQKFQPDQHFEIALRVAEFMLSNMRDKDTGYLSTIFNIINRRHGYEFSVDYEYIILGLFNEYEWCSDTDASWTPRWEILYQALQSHLAQRKVNERRLVEWLPENAMFTDIELCCDTVCAWHEHGFSVSAVVQQVLHDSSSDHHREVARNIAEFLRECMPDKEQHYNHMRKEISFASGIIKCKGANLNVEFAEERRIAQMRPRKLRKLNYSKKAELTTQQVRKAIAMTGDDSTKRMIVKYIVMTYNVDNNETLKKHVIQVVDQGVKTNLIKKGSTSHRFSLIYC